MNRKTQSGLVMGAVIALLPVTQASGIPKTIYVNDDSMCEDPCDRDGGENTCGDSFTNACKILQDALDTAIDGDQIWVEAGTYYPDEGSGVTNNERTETFTLIDGVDLYGGFLGGEASVSARIFKCSNGGGSHGSPCTSNACCNAAENELCLPEAETILSGDIDGDDSGTCTIDDDCGDSNDLCAGGVCLFDDNSYHVVTYDDPGAEVIFDGFIIEHGKADAASAINNQGGGIQVRAPGFCTSSTGIGCLDDGDCPGADCDLTSNSGPCIDTAAAALSIKNVVVRNNYASNHGAVNDHGSATSIDNCLFRDNTAVVQGAGLVIDNGSASVTDCVFYKNNVTLVTTPFGTGGAVWVASRSDSGCPSSPVPQITDCFFSNNAAAKGGGAFTLSSDASFTDCTFFENTVIAPTPSSADTGGGGIWTDGGNPECTRCLFEKNRSDFGVGGGGSYSTNGGHHPTPSNPLFDSCTFRGNFAALAGGGSYNTTSVDATFMDCLFVDNWSNSIGGAVYESATTTYVNTRFLGNGSPGGALIMFASVADATMTNCIVAATRTGGAIIFSGGELTAYDSAFIGNNGGGIKGAGATTTCVNTVLWDNDDRNPSTSVEDDQASGALTITYSDWQGHTGGTGNINLDPAFVMDESGTWTANASYNSTDDTTTLYDTGPSWAPDELIDNIIIPDTSDGEYTIVLENTETEITVRGDFSGVVITDAYEMTALRITSSSPAHDAGDNDSVPEGVTDLDGNKRIVNGTVDMGPYEVQAMLTDSSFDCDDTLPRTNTNVLRFTFDLDITTPSAGDIEIRELLSSGDLGNDLSSEFLFSVEGSNVLRVEEDEDVLVNETWYAILNTGGWQGVASFEMDYAVVYGDANNTTFTSFADLSAINANMIDPAADDDRHDINGSGFVNFADLSAANANMDSEAPTKPTGHSCTLP